MKHAKGKTLRLPSWEELQFWLRQPISIWIVTGLLALLILLQWVQLIARMGTGSAGITEQLPHIAVVTPKDIGKFHWFGQYQLVDANYLPMTQLNLDLQGILFSANPAKTQALIAFPGQAPKVYHKGDHLLGNVIIKQILQNSVILDQNGELEKLPLKQLELQFAPPPKGLE
jgi:type II secretory pathway component PulC